MFYCPRFEVPRCFDNESGSLLQSSAVPTDMWLPMFRRSIMPSSAGSEVQEESAFLNFTTGHSLTFHTLGSLCFIVITVLGCDT